MFDPIARDPFFDPPVPKNRLPAAVNVATILLLILAVYTITMALPLTLGGAMMNQMMFIAGIVHAAIAAVSFTSWKGLLNRRRWARWPAILLASLGMLVLPYAIFEGWMSGILEPGAAIFGGVISAYGSALLWTLTRPSVGAWLAPGSVVGPV